MFATVSIKKGGLKGERVRPQPIRPQIKFPRGILDQVISLRAHDGGRERAPGPGLKLQATSIKLQAPSVKLSNQPVQAPSGKHPNQSNKHQASSLKLQAP